CAVAFGVLDPFNAGDPGVFVYSFSSPGLLAGESSECRARYAVDPNLEGDITISWTISSLLTQPIDPNTTNNSSAVTFGIPSPTEVPGLNVFGVAVLMFLLCVTATINSAAPRESRTVKRITV
ncbi:MAG: hypothetical protein AAGC71_17525, partial [Pseudomonadota bacterium]